MANPKVYQRGGVQWVRLSYDGIDRRVSCGTEREDLANDRVRIFYESAKRDRHITLLQAIVAGRLSLHDFAVAYYTDTLEQLKKRANDVNLEPAVHRWLRELRVAGERHPDTIKEYDHQVHSLIAPGVPFYASELNPKRIKEWLLSLRHMRTGLPVSTTTRRHYYDALRAFVRWARVEGLVQRDALEEVETPKLNKARDRILEYPALVAALEAVPPGPVRAALWLAAGSGMEQQAMQRVHGRDVILGQPVLGRTLNGVWAHGSKNGYRSRLAFVREWAWKEVARVTVDALPTARLIDAGERWILREWRKAQIAAKVADERTVLTVHDLRHCYTVMCVLGTDGEPRMDLQWCADQLGHADTVMVSRVYAKYRLRDRLRAVEALEAQQAAPAPTFNTQHGLQVMR